MDLSLIIQLLSGAAGGNIAGSLLKNQSLGPIGNTLAGVVGGGLGGQILNSALGLGKVAAASGMDIGTIVSQVAGGGVGGGVLMIVVGILKKMLAK